MMGQEKTPDNESRGGEALFGSLGPPPGRVGRAKRRVRRIVFKILDKNPYNEGSLGDLSWKVRRGEPLSEEEQETQNQIDQASRSLERLHESIAMASYRFSLAAAYFEVGAELMDNLPGLLRDHVMNLPAGEASKVIEHLLPLADFRRQRTAVKVAQYALIISGSAFLISTVTLGVAVWALVNI